VGDTLEFVESVAGCPVSLGKQLQLSRSSTDAVRLEMELAPHRGRRLNWDRPL